MSEDNSKPPVPKESIPTASTGPKTPAGETAPGVAELAPAKTVSPDIQRLGREAERLTPPNANPGGAPLSSETLFAFALPEAIQRRLIDNATQIFQKSELDEIVKNIPLPFKQPEEVHQTEPQQRRSEAQVALIIKTLLGVLYVLVLLLIFKSL